VLTMGLALVWPLLFRPLADVERYEQLRPPSAPAPD